MRYADAAKAIDWLCDAFGFERHLIVPGENGAITHAQLTFGNGTLMLGSGGEHDGPCAEAADSSDSRHFLPDQDPESICSQLPSRRNPFATHC